MFTGIVQHLGKVADVSSHETGDRLVVDAAGWSHRPQPGDSIAVNGCCLTVAGIDPDAPALHFDVVHQTLRRTALGALKTGDAVNIEHAATPGTLLGGHIVQGHVDGVGTVEDVSTVGGEYRIRIRCQQQDDAIDLMECIVERGSIAVDGVSLTVAAVDEPAFEIALVPTTLERTTLGRLRRGSPVNLETDYIARTVIHWLKRQRS